MAETADQRAHRVAYESANSITFEDEVAIAHAIRAAEAAAKASQCEECAKMLEALAEGKDNIVAEATRSLAGILRCHGAQIASDTRSEDPTA